MRIRIRILSEYVGKSKTDSSGSGPKRKLRRAPERC